MLLRPKLRRAKTYKAKSCQYACQRHRAHEHDSNSTSLRGVN
jgi:hypothetical protein